MQCWLEGPHNISSSFPEKVVLMLSVGHWFLGEPVPNEGAQLPPLSKATSSFKGLVWDIPMATLYHLP